MSPPVHRTERSEILAGELGGSVPPPRWTGRLDARRCAPWLWLLTALFALRVAAQPAALLINVTWLPPFDSWHGGVLPYPVLLLAQFAILGWLAWTARRFGSGRIEPSRRLGRASLRFGTVYFVVMLVRLVLGLSVLSHVRWFASPLPAFFHLVLASYVVLFGIVHLGAAASTVPSALRTKDGVTSGVKAIG